MATLILQNQKVFLAGRDLSGFTNQVAMNYAAALEDSTTLGSTTHTRVGGLFDATFNVQGFDDGGQVANSLDADLFAEPGTPTVMTLATANGNQLDEALFLNAEAVSYKQSGQIGKLLGFTFDVQAGNSPLIKGNVELPLSTVTSTGTSAGQQLGAVSSSQSLWAAMHITAVAGTLPTLTMTVQSATSGAFTSPTSRISFSSQNARGGLLQSVAGPITDQFFRGSYVITGSAGQSFTVALILGIR